MFGIEKSVGAESHEAFVRQEVQQTVAQASESIRNLLQSKGLSVHAIGAWVTYLMAKLKYVGAKQEEIQSALIELSKNSGASLSTLIKYSQFYRQLPSSAISDFPAIQESAWLRILNLPIQISSWVAFNLWEQVMQLGGEVDKKMVGELFSQLFPPKEKEKSASQLRITFRDIVVRTIGDEKGEMKVLDSVDAMLRPQEVVDIVEKIQEIAGIDPESSKDDDPKIEISIKVSGIDRDTLEKIEEALSIDFDPDIIQY